MVKFKIAVLTFNNAVEANACLGKLDLQMDNWLQGFIDFSTSFSRGVITDWPYDIPELWENIIDKASIFKIEKMRRRVWDQESKKFIMQYTNNFLVTMKGNKIKERIMIFDKLYIVKDLHRENTV